MFKVLYIDNPERNKDPAANIVCKDSFFATNKLSIKDREPKL